MLIYDKHPGFTKTYRKMPKKVNMSKRVAVENKNKKVLTDAMDGKEAIFGKVEKALGNCAFKIHIQDQASKVPKLKAVQGLIRGSFKGGSKSEVFLSAGMFVILGPAEKRAESHEIIGVINRKKDLKALMDNKLLPEILLEAQDELFDYTDFVEDDGLDKENRKSRDRILAAVAAGGGAKSGTTADDDEVNLDDI